MTPAEIKEARRNLGLTQSELAQMLDTSPRIVRSFETDKTRSTHRAPGPRVVRLIEAYLSGYRPPDWPGER